VRFRPLAFIPLLVSALCIVLLVRMSHDDPRYLLAAGAVFVVTMLPAVLARRRLRRVLLSGDVHRVLTAWQPTMERVSHPETMAPLMIATAYASYGWLEPARDALSRAVRGPAWDAAREQRLLIEALLATFEGEREASLDKARELEGMPLPSSGLFLRRRVARLRGGVAALARAFAHESSSEDERRLSRAASASPLMHWAMRYARAIVAIDRGEQEHARSLLAGTPEWPEASAFASFHAELMNKLGA